MFVFGNHPHSMFAVLLVPPTLADTASPAALLQPGLNGEQPPLANETKVLKVDETETAINCTSTLSSVSDEDCVNQCGSPSLFFKSCPTDICECVDADGNEYP